ncbi:MAG TPA: 4-alpha-glucanotransferase [Chitinophagaceae bacterium]|nr:4-alpha-glucanotransferase [Chitinophagaceae bacterium]
MTMIKLQFYIRFHTHFGESLWLSGNTDLLGNDDPGKALPLAYLNDEFWHQSVEIKNKNLPESIRYKYFLKNKEGELVREWGNDRVIDHLKKEIHEIQLVDTWNHAGEYENVFFTVPFRNVLLKENTAKVKAKDVEKKFTHIFRVKAPLLKKNETICLLGSGETLGDWSTHKPALLSKNGNWYEIKLNLSKESFPVAYKYCVYNTKSKALVEYEAGNNRLLYGDAAKKKINILHDGFAHLANNTWKGAGVAIPVFSLRSKNSFGSGEFEDIKLLADWPKDAGLKLIQLLPVNDTTATHTVADSYPYAAISAFALHPIYINLWKLAGEAHAEKIKAIKRKQSQLNKTLGMDYEETMKLKSAALKELFAVMGEECFATDNYKKFFTDNEHWLIPYAVFCFLRDKNGHSNFAQWKSNSIFNKKEIEKLSSPGSASYKEIAFWYFVQYHLHVQLNDAVDYAHKKGVVLKGDLPIGIYRNGCDAWMAPEFFNMNDQVGAPPDDFAIKGQNWGFPSYNWKRMQEDGFDWWKKRFCQMSHYFDAFRIDHILGFFRTWNIPVHAVEGIMGHFIPAIPVHIVEFGETGIWFERQRYCKPFINDEVLNEIFGELADKVRAEFLIPLHSSEYELQPQFETQRQVEQFFSVLAPSEENKRLKQGLYDLISNVLLFKEEGSQGEKFHFRIAMEKTSSFRHLVPFVQEKLKALYINYYYQRQDHFWAQEAMNKLPQLKAATDMLVCGEDLGMVPHCVPDVMKQLGIISLEIQRMPKNPKIEFFHPNDAPYLSVVTPSTHDMSTIRGWWEENREKTRHFYNNMLGQHGEAPVYCESWINRAIVLQHLYSPAIWGIFQMQDILGMSETLRRENPNEERINVPANPNHFWNYRMHINLEDLIKAKEFNEELKGYVVHSGRN